MHWVNWLAPTPSLTSNWKHGTESKSHWLPFSSLYSCCSRTSVPITDDEDRVIAVLAGCPDDAEWQQVHEEAAEALESSRDKLKKPSEKVLENRERRGHFPQEAVGESMGGGQKVESYILCFRTTVPTNSHPPRVGSRNAQVYEQDCT